MLVLSAIVVLTTMLVEFAYNTNVNYHLALNERDRLQAYYMARSAYNFMLLELKFDRVFRKMVERQNLSQYLGDAMQLPLCQQFPLSTGIIRAVFTGGGLAGLMGGEEGEEGSEESEVAEQIEDMQKGTSLSQEKSAAEFLEFEGDFDGECADEGTKINLNGFAGLRHTSVTEGGVSAFDEYKRFLYSFLSKPEFEDLFEAADVRETDVIDNIGDWIDPDTEVNQFDGRGGGAERSLYDRRDAEYSVRNGKLITLLEVYLIDGVVDTWFEPLEEYFTIYGDGKINVCVAGSDIVESLIKRYIASTPGLPPVRADDPEEMARLMGAITTACSAGGSGEQLAQNVATALNQAIRGETAEEEETVPREGEQGQDNGFASYITSETRFFTLKLAGQVADTTVRIKAVIDVKERSPKKWKLLYWQVY